MDNPGTYNSSEALFSQDYQAASAVLYWNAPLPQFQNAPTINISSSSGASSEAGSVVVTGEYEGVHEDTVCVLC